MFCQKTFTIKSIQKSIFRRPSHMNKIRLFSKSVFFKIRFTYKTMTKHIVFQNNFGRKNGFILQYLRQSAFKAQQRWRGLMLKVAI